MTAQAKAQCFFFLKSSHVCGSIYVIWRVCQVSSRPNILGQKERIPSHSAARPPTSPEPQRGGVPKNMRLPALLLPEKAEAAA